MDSTTEATLISKLESTDLTNIQSLFSSYLHPFTSLLNSQYPNSKSKRPSKTLVDTASHSTTRSLAKQFLPFLNKTLCVIPKRLSESPKISIQSALELFHIYKLCLNCLDSISSQLSCKPYSVHIQRVRLTHCFQAWERYKDAEIEGLSVLESLRGIQSGVSGAKGTKAKGKFVPELNKESVDQDFALLVVEIVVALVKCTSTSQSKEEADYCRVLTLVDEVSPWFRVVDANKNEKMHMVLVTCLSRCAVFLVEELRCFNGRLVHKFCLATFTEHSKSSMKDPMYK
ncbi:unnamed protein product, partial [Ilex paraguariensis]